MATEQPRWLSLVPGFCDTCDGPIKKVFYDAKTSGGPWANMCKTCFNRGPGIGKLGTGLGQEYTEQGKYWVKTGG
jgi:hypothetical protein